MCLSTCEDLKLLVRILLLLIGVLKTGGALSLVAFDGDKEVLVYCGQELQIASSWTLDGSPLEDIVGISFETEINPYQLVLWNVNQSAEGTYECLDGDNNVLASSTLTIIARPSFAGCDPNSLTESSCSIFPIGAVTSSNITFNASITYSDAMTKPFISEIGITDSSNQVLVTCTQNSPCTFSNAFAERGISSSVDNSLDTVLIMVQDPSLNDTGTYFLTIEYFVGQGSTDKKIYTATVDVNVTSEEVTTPSPTSASIPTSTSILVTSSQVSSTFPPSPSTSLPVEQTSSTPSAGNTVEPTVDSVAPTEDNWMVFAGAVVGTFIFTIIVCLMIVAAVAVVHVTRQRIQKKSDCESSSDSDSQTSSTTTTAESSDPLPISSPIEQTEERSETIASKELTTDLLPNRHIVISQSIHSLPYVDTTPPEPTGDFPKLSPDKNSQSTYI